MKQQRPEPRTLIGQPPQRSKEHLPDAYSGPERDQYASRALAYVILLNGVAALILVTSLAFGSSIGNRSSQTCLGHDGVRVRCIGGAAEFVTCIYQSNSNGRGVRPCGRAGPIARRCDYRGCWLRRGIFDGPEHDGTHRSREFQHSPQEQASVSNSNPGSSPGQRRTSNATCAARKSPLEVG